MFTVSPGIVTNEVDLSQVVSSVSTTAAALAGVFSWGPIDDTELVSSEGELVYRYGKPTSNNYETFYSASNYLAYSNKLYITRAGDSNNKNAVGGEGNTAGYLVKNEVDYNTKVSTLPANSAFIAKYAGSLGNSLKIAVCATENAYSSVVAAPDAFSNLAISFSTNSNVAVFTVSSSNSATANTATLAVLSTLNVGDYVVAGNTTIGTQYIKVTALGTPTIAGTEGSFSVNLANKFFLAANTTSNTVKRYWEFYNTVSGAPKTSVYAANRGGAGDELHVVVIDAGGRFTGTPGTVLEVYEDVSRATDALLEQGGTNFWKTRINQSSTYLWAGSAINGVTTGVASAITPLSNVSPKNYTLAGGVDTVSETAVSLADLARAYDKYKSASTIDISVIITGKSVGGANGEGLPNYIIDNICETRKDCVVVVSPPLVAVVDNPYKEAEAVTDFRESLRATSYAFMDSGYKYQYDRYNDTYRWIPLNADIAGTFARTDEDRDPWWSPAGFSRGVIKNVVKLAYNPDSADRDILYSADVNPVVSFPGSDPILYGDKTLLGRNSAFSRINVRRLFIILEKAIAKAAQTTLFEFNDDFTRSQFRNLITPYLRDIQGRRGIYEFKVVCDTSNNTGQVIDNNQFIGDIYLKPARSINFIKLNFVAVRTDVEFDEVVGQF